MPRDKSRLNVRLAFQCLAGFFLTAALLFDPGCHADHKVVIQEVAPIQPPQRVGPPAAAPVEAAPFPGDHTMRAVAAGAVSAPSAAPSEASSEPAAASPFETLLARDPLEAMRRLYEHAAQANFEYTCLFTRQERLPTGVGPDQDARVKFRAQPHSVQMEFVRNPGLVKRVIFVKGRWVDESATDPALRDQALVQPHGLAGVLIKSLKQPINGAMAKRTGRRSIDQFGFANALKLIVKYSEEAAAEDALSLTYEGVGEFDGRRVWIIRRVLPYTGEDGHYPDRVAITYIDVEHRVPIAIHTYSDEACRPEDLLGKYEYRDVNFSPGLTDADFDPATYGL